jgi:hypothetical protein
LIILQEIEIEVIFMLKSRRTDSVNSWQILDSHGGFFVRVQGVEKGPRHGVGNILGSKARRMVVFSATINKSGQFVKQLLVAVLS